MSEDSLLKKVARDPGRALSVLAHKCLTPIGHKGYKRFVVLTRDRTGSNMLIQMLNSHPHIAADYEVFGKLFGNSEQEILDKTFSRQPFFIKAKGFKIFYYHPQDAENSSIWQTLEEMDGLYVIHLKRRNILHALVSSRVAYTTGVYGIRSDKEFSEYEKKLAPVTYSEAELREGFEQTRGWEEEGDARFSHHPKITVYYEDLVNEPARVFREITDFIGVEFHAPKTDFRKQSARSTRGNLANYDDLKSAFYDTPWQGFFDE